MSIIKYVILLILLLLLPNLSVRADEVLGESSMKKDPKNIDECVQELIARLPKDIVAKMRSEPTNTAMDKYYDTIGLDIRNNYLLGHSDSPLPKVFFNQGIHNAGNMSSIILIALWDKLHSHKTNLDELFKSYRRSESVNKSEVSEKAKIPKNIDNMVLSINGGKKISLAQLRGKVVLLVDFTVVGVGSDEACQFANAQRRRYGEKALEIIGLVESERFEPEPNYKQKFIERLKPSFPIVMDPPLNYCSDLIAPGVLTLPEIILIGRDGVIITRFNGWHPQIPDILNEKVAAAVKIGNSKE